MEDISVEFDEILGKKIIRVDESDGGIAKIVFYCEGGDVFYTYHWQDCCEQVYLEDVDNPLSVLVGETITSVFVNSESNPNASESGTYTFYTLASPNVSVTMRFNGESNGYYSESVDFYQRVNT